MAGNNMDVLTPEELPHSQGYCGGWSGGSSRIDAETDLAAVELVLDLAILEDGLCVGPDESALYEALNESLDLQRRTAQEAIKALQAGASLGKVFEIVQPLARHSTPEPQKEGHLHARAMLTFGDEAVHRLINSNAPELFAFFERAAQPPALQLRRPK